MKIQYSFQVRTASSYATVRTGLSRRPDAPQCLEASAIAAVRTTELHHLDARSSYSKSE
jgi:hypothetical protein